MGALVAADDIKRVLIRKSPDGFAGGWKLARVRVWFRGELKCDVARTSGWKMTTAGGSDA